MTKVLIIEDDHDQSFLYQTVFNISGLSATSVSNEADALKAVAAEKPDIILSDIMLKGENGLDIIEELHMNEENKKIPFIVFTNTNKDEFKNRARELGAADYIIKSDTIPQQMAERIKGYLSEQ